MLGMLLLAAALAPQAAPRAGTVRVEFAPPLAGEGVRVVATVETRHAIVFAVAGATLRDFEQTLRDSRAFEARLADAAGREPSLRISYGECRSVLTGPTGEDSHAIPLESRGFLVERVAAAGGDGSGGGDRGGGGAPRLLVKEVFSGSGEPRDVEASIAAQVERDVGELLLGARFSPLLQGRELPVGERIDVPRELARSLLAGVLDAGTVESFALTPKEGGFEGDVAFAASLVVTMKQGDDLPVSSTFELSGEIVLGRGHGRVTSIDLGGPIRFGGSKEENGTRIEVRGTGSLAWKYRVTPIPAR
jgi:hypothetical protein